MKTDIEKWINEDGERFLRSIGLKEGQIVLDFGCGEGHYTIPLAKVVGEKGKVYGFDKDKEALNSLRRLMLTQRLKNIELIKGNTKLPLREASLDAVLCYDVIHYYRARGPLYKEIYRLLKPSGLFSLYPKHYRDDFPLMELVNIDLEEIIREVERAGFVLKSKLFRVLLHNEHYNEGCVINFNKLGV